METPLQPYWVVDKLKEAQGRRPESGVAKTDAGFKGGPGPLWRHLRLCPLASLSQNMGRGMPCLQTVPPLQKGFHGTQWNSVLQTLPPLLLLCLRSVTHKWLCRRNECRTAPVGSPPLLPAARRHGTSGSVFATFQGVPLLFQTGPGGGPARSWGRTAPLAPIVSPAMSGPWQTPAPCLCLA